MLDIKASALQIYSKWEKPSTREVKLVLDLLNWESKDLSFNDKFIGFHDRSIRYWFVYYESDVEVESTIPYVSWAILVYLATGKIIFETAGNVFNTIPSCYFTEYVNFDVPTAEVLNQIVGKKSLTKLTRGTLCARLGLNAAKFGRNCNEGKISFVNWLALLLMCGFKIEKLVKTAK